MSYFEKDERNVGLAFLFLLMSILFAVISIFVTGYVGYKLWGWFITPVFSIQAPGVLAIMGLRLCYDLFSMRVEKDADDSTSSGHLRHAMYISVRNFFALQLGKLLALLFGWIFYSFM